jgi:uncharacterized protein
MSSAGEPLKVAVIEGWHPFDVIGFNKLFRSIDGIDAYHQSVDNWAVDAAEMRLKYDVLVFYNMNPKFEPEYFAPAIEKAVNELGRPEKQGIVVLHHALLAYAENETWSKLVGIQNRKFWFYNEQTYPMEIANPEHPIVRGIDGWDMFDETYTMDSPDETSELILTTSYQPSMRAIAWTRRHGNAPVFCFQCGHDARSWEIPQFKEILTRGIRWTAGVLETADSSA